LDSAAYGSHVPAAVQHPFGHEVASQMQVPVTVAHSCPVAQALQTAPPAPHEPFVSVPSGSHVVPLQQPVQEAPPQVQSPSEQASPGAHAEHAAPPVPHSEPPCETYGTHTLPLQQPSGHDVASHTHCPFVLLHSWVGRHAAHVAPAAPHEPFDSPA
jgi:hypothetical protein